MTSPFGRDIDNGRRRVATAPRISEQRPLPRPVAWRAVFGCVVTCVALLARRRTHLPRGNVGTRLWFADGTSAEVYRETVVDCCGVAEPCGLVVTFRLRHVHGVGHKLFRAESLLNTVLFVGFPGLVSKLWLANDEREAYRGVYEWDGADRAEFYARSLWRVLALVSERDSIHYVVRPGLRRDDMFDDRGVGGADWWRITAVGCATRGRETSAHVHSGR